MTLRLIFRLGLLSFVLAAALILAAFGVGSLIASDALAYRAGDGYVFRDLARGASYWRDLDLPSEFIPEAWSDDARHYATLALREDGSRTLRVYDLRENAIRCEEIIPGDFVYTYFLTWYDDATLLYSHSDVDASGLYRFDLGTCAATHLADVTGRLDYARIAKPYAAFIGERRGDYTVYVLDVETGDLARLNNEPTTSTNTYAYWRPVDRQQLRGDPCCLLYGDGQSLNLYHPEAGTTQTIDSAGQRVYWLNQHAIVIYTSQENTLFSIVELRPYADHRIGEPLVSILNTLSPTFAPDLRYMAYVEVDAGVTTLQPGVVSPVTLLDIENGTTTPILPEMDRAGQVEFSPDGRWLLIHPRATALSSMLYEIATGAVYDLGLNLNPYQGTIWLNQGLLYTDQNDDLVRYDLVEHTTQTILNTAAGEQFNGVWTHEDYAAILTNSGSDRCLYLFDQRQRSTTLLGCSTMALFSSLRWIPDAP